MMPGCLTLLFDETEPHVTSLLFKQTTHMYQKKCYTLHELAWFDKYEFIEIEIENTNQ